MWVEKVNFYDFPASNCSCGGPNLNILPYINIFTNTYTRYQIPGHFGEIGPFYAHFSPEASKRDFWGSEILFLATGAAGDRPPTGLGFGLAARGRGEPGQATVCLGVTYLRGYSSVVRGVDRRRY